MRQWESFVTDWLLFCFFELGSVKAYTPTRAITNRSTTTAVVGAMFTTVFFEIALRRCVENRSTKAAYDGILRPKGSTSVFADVFGCYGKFCNLLGGTTPRLQLGWPNKLWDNVAQPPRGALVEGAGHDGGL